MVKCRKHILFNDIEKTLMKEFKLDYGKFILHDDGIFEAIVNEGVELTEELVNQYLELVYSLKPVPGKMLVNRINKYSYSFKASRMLASAKGVNHVAIVKYGRLPWPIKGIFTPKLYGLAFFDERETAIEWLNSKS